VQGGIVAQNHGAEQDQESLGAVITGSIEFIERRPQVIHQVIQANNTGKEESWE
jgi:hypothetical protein